MIEVVGALRIEPAQGGERGGGGLPRWRAQHHDAQPEAREPLRAQKGQAGRPSAPERSGRGSEREDLPAHDRIAGAVERKQARIASQQLEDVPLARLLERPDVRAQRTAQSRRQPLQPGQAHVGHPRHVHTRQPLQCRHRDLRTGERSEQHGKDHDSPHGARLHHALQVSDEGRKCHAGTSSLLDGHERFGREPS